MSSCMHPAHKSRVNPAEYTARYANAEQVGGQNGHARGDDSMSEADGSQGSFLSSSDDDEEDPPTTGVADMP